MKATAAFAAKRALFDRITVLSGHTGPLAGVQVSYDYPGDAQRELVYGGGATFTQTEELHDGQRAVRRDTVTVGLYVAVTGHGQDARTTDARAEQIADAIAEELSARPRLDGRLTFQEINGGRADYWPVDEATETRLSLQVVFTTLLT